MQRFNFNLNSSKIFWSLTPVQVNNDKYYWYRQETPIESHNLFSWLHQQIIYPKLFWSSRDEPEELAAVGSVFTSPTVPVLKSYDPIDGNTPFSFKFFGATSFSHSLRKTEFWNDFPNICFFLPQFELISKKEGFFFAVNSLSHHKLTPKSFQKDLSGLIFNTPLASFTPDTLQTITHLPNRNTWKKQLAYVIKKMQQQAFNKVVLARQTTLSFSKNIDPFLLLQSLKQAASNNYLFGIQLNAKSAFLSATPERLFKRKHLELQTEAIAGTRPRSQDEKEDERLANELLSSKKDLKEIDYVRDDILKILKPICHKLSTNKKYAIIKATTVQHLFTRFKGTLLNHIKDAAIIDLLHPTPAICGTPCHHALDHILDLEPFDRGWYAAPIGWIAPKATELAVGIRSCLIKENQVHLFAGGGILENSDPEKEWEELEYKTQLFQRILQ